MWQQVTSTLASLNWAAPTWDVFILLFFIVGALLYGLSLGRDRIIVILVSMYMALAVASNTPELAKLDQQMSSSGNSIVRVSFFLIVFVAVFFLISRSSLLKSLGGSTAPRSWWQTILFSILQVGLLITIILSFLPTTMTQNLSPLTQQIFMSDNGKSAWMLLPIIFMVLAPKQKSDRF